MTPIPPLGFDVVTTVNAAVTGAIGPAKRLTVTRSYYARPLPFALQLDVTLGKPHALLHVERRTDDLNASPIPFDGHLISAATRALLGRPLRLLIDGEWVDGADGETFDTEDPATGLRLARVAAGTASDIDRAVAAARRAFEGHWLHVTARERARLLFRLAALIQAHVTTFTEIEIIDNGMPRFIAALTVANCVDMLEYYAGWATKIEGVTTASPPHVTEFAEALTYTLREPLGVAGLIVPWNVPLSTAILKVAPALAAGCTVVLKPSEETPLAAAYLGELILEAGFPPGVVNIVHGRGEIVGAALAAHADIDKISFTGSTEVGRKIIAAAAGNLKKVSLELGGKSPVVVMPDADLAAAVRGVAMATFFLQGQNCMAGTRIFVHEAIHDELLDGLVAYTRAMVLGHGLDPATQIGPLISANHAASVASYIRLGIDEGATLAAGGTALERNGHFLRPTIFTNTHARMAIVREEIFGPVMAIHRFDSMDAEAIARMANDTVYGLSGSVWTHDLSMAHRLVRRIRAGQVSINCHGAVATNIPFGGYKQSGWGREFGREGMDAYLETKAVTALLSSRSRMRGER